MRIDVEANLSDGWMDERIKESDGRMEGWVDGWIKESDGRMEK